MKPPVDATAGDWLDQLAGQFGLGRGVLEEWIWGILLVGLALSVLHLLTMLVTRWGDRNPTAKTMIFSVMAHLLLLLGWRVFVPESPPRTDEVAEVTVPIRQIDVSSDERIDLRESGNTPAWEKPPEPVKPEMARTESDAEPLPLESPERRAEAPAEPSPIDLPDVPSRPNEPIATPKLEHQGVRDTLAEAAIPLEVPVPEKIDLPQPDAPERPRAMPLRQDRIEPTITRQVTPGAVERIERDVTPSRELAALPVPADPQAFLRRTPATADPVTRGGPAPAPLPADVSGMAADQPSQGSSSGSPLSFRPSRLGTRSSDDRPGTSIERLRPDTTPAAPDAVGDESLAMIDGVSRPFTSRAATPNLIRPSGESVVRRPSETSVPMIYRSRDQVRRKAVALQNGGSEESEAAVDLALQWLARHQTAAGFWDADAYGAGQVKFDSEGHDRQNAGRTADVGITALAVLAFLGAGHTHQTGDYTDNVERALRWLIAQQRSDDGCLAPSAAHYEQMYCHGMAAYALAEAYGMQPARSEGLPLRQPLQRAIDFILETQNDDGGWRYDPVKSDELSDMSMFGWQVMALKRAETAGLPIPKAAEEKMVKFLIDRSLGESKGLAAYYPGQKATASMTAEALYCKQRFGIRRDNPAAVEAAEHLLKNLPRPSQMNVYAWYYAALAMFDYGAVADPDAPHDEPAARRRRGQWETWNTALRDTLIGTQITQGADTGSWPPTDVWGAYGGRIYSTALATLCLEVYYRAGITDAE